MARIRSIKPEFWSDEKIVDLSPIAKLLYIGIWNFADDQGYIKDSVRQLQLKVFPGNVYDVESARGELVEAGLVVECASDQGDILVVPKFRDHQSPKNPTPTKITGIRARSYPSGTPEVPHNSGTIPEAGGTERRGEERRGEERRGEGEDVAAERADVSMLCTLLADLIEQNGSRRPRITKGWVDAARLMIDKDKRDPAKASNLIRWSQQNEFWRSTIMSMPKFREQYDKLRLQALRDHEAAKPKVDPDAWMNR